MKSRIGPAIALLLLAAAPLLGQAPVRADGDSSVMSEVEALEHHLIDLLERRDLEAYAPHLAEDYMRVNARGIVASKDEALAGLASGANPVRQSPSDIEVRVYGDTAILTFVLTQEREGERSVRTRLVKVFVRREGSWIMVHNQGTPLE